jgi:hypothetical protein
VRLSFGASRALQSLRSFWLVASACLLSACLSGTPAGPQLIGEGRRILFIGNSLTYVNGLPYMFAALADSLGEPPPVVEEVAFPDFGLEQHWEDGRAAREIRGGCWDTVVPQQGPFHLTSDRFARLDHDGRVVFDLSRVPIAERAVLDQHAQMLGGGLVVPAS